MNFAMQTDLIGVRVEVVPTEFSHGGDREAITGTIRTVFSFQGSIAFQIEDDDGWIHVRTSAYSKFRVVRARECEPIHESFRNAVYHNGRRVKRFHELAIGAAFLWNNTPSGWYDGKLLKVSKMPGWAAPEGWGYVKADEPEIQNELVEVIDDIVPPSTGPIVPEDPEL